MDRRGALGLVVLVSCSGGDGKGRGELRGIVTGQGASAGEGLAGSMPSILPATGACGGTCPIGANCDVPFAPPLRIAAPMSAQQLLLGDFDGDQRRDIVTVAGGAIWISRGTPTGLAAPTMVTLTTGTSITNGRIDADADLDLVVSNGNSGYTVYLNDGTGGFAAQPTIATPTGAFHYALGDVTGDQVTDLVDDLGNVYGGNATGTFAPLVSAPATDAPLLISSDAVMLLDLDANGSNDILLLHVHNDGGGTHKRNVEWFLNTGTGTFGARAKPSQDMTETAAFAPIHAIGDDKIDAAIGVYAGTYEYDFVKLAGTGSPTRFGPLTQQRPRLVIAGDLTNDAMPEIVSGEAPSTLNGAGAIRIFSPTAVTIPLTDGVVRRTAAAGVIADFTNDARSDILISDGVDSYWLIAATGGTACAVPGTPGPTCASTATLCADNTTCCPTGYTCGASGECVKLGPGPAPDTCGTGFCPVGTTCDNGTCTSAEYPVGCGDRACLPGATCESGTCGCPPARPACGDQCCNNPDDICVDGACRAPCDAAMFPTVCGLACCSTEVSCDNNTCGCPSDHPSACDGDNVTWCCLAGAPCSNGQCGCPDARVACGDQCCAAGDVCRNGACARPSGSSGGTCLDGSSRACIDFGANGNCDGCSGNPDTCIPFSEWTSRGFDPPSSCKASGETGCFYHAPNGVNNFLVAPCCEGLTCQVGPGCSSGADTGTCLP